MSKEGATRLLLAGGVFVSLVFLVVLLFVGAWRTGFSTRRSFGGLLSLSDWGREPIANSLICGLLCLGCAVYCTGNTAWHGWSTYSIVVGVALALTFVLSNITAALDMIDASPTGFIQHVGIVLGWTWIALSSWPLWRQRISPRDSN